MSNCLFFALGRFSKGWKTGGYLTIRKSRHGWWPHFGWSADLSTFEEFIPIVPAHERRLPPLIFRGRIRIFGAEDE